MEDACSNRSMNMSFIRGGFPFNAMNVLHTRWPFFQCIVINKLMAIGLVNSLPQNV